jgi:DMSO/TMAO reductase YedYZ molybdopterin-dependent catalytic subunit
VFGLALLAALPIVIATGLLSYIAYAPQLGQAIPADVGWLRLPVFAWPVGPAWLYRLTQGVHVVVGLAVIPLVLAKLWSVMPRLFLWPPVRSIAQLLERISLLMLVGGIVFEIVTGVLNIQYDYVFGFSFYTAHYFGAWVFIAGFGMHVAVKLPKMIAGLRSLRPRKVLATNLADTRPQPPDPDHLVAADPDAPTMSRRGALGLVGSGALLMTVLSAGQVIGGPARGSALLLPRGRSRGAGDFQVNKTAAAAGIDPARVDGSWRLILRGGTSEVALDRAALTALPQHSARLPIACVEGWATTQTWTGVRLADLARLAGVPAARSAQVVSLQPVGPFSRASLQANQIAHPDALLALRVNGADLSLDHGYPARIIVPALPGVHNTKWVAYVEFESS